MAVALVLLVFGKSAQRAAAAAATQTEVVEVVGSGSSAQSSEGPAAVVTGFTFGAILGGNIFDIGEHLQGVGRAYDNRLSVGARLHYALSPRFAVEGSLLFTPASTSLTGVRLDPGELAETPQEDRLVDEVNVATFYSMANLVLNLQTRGEWVPYVTAGAGIVTLDVDGAGVEHRPGGNFGLGAWFVPSHRFAVRLEVRDYIYRLGDLERSSFEALSLPASFDETINDLAFSVGASYLF